jgi:hypothetical protein
LGRDFVTDVGRRWIVDLSTIRRKKSPGLATGASRLYRCRRRVRIQSAGIALAASPAGGAVDARVAHQPPLSRVAVERRLENEAVHALNSAVRRAEAPDVSKKSPGTPGLEAVSIRRRG